MGSAEQELLSQSRERGMPRIDSLTPPRRQKEERERKLSKPYQNFDGRKGV